MHKITCTVQILGPKNIKRILNMDLLKDKTVLITGASRGIGNGIARLFSQNGANIAFTYRSSAEQANSLELDLMKSGSKAKGYSSDASCF